MTLRQQTLYWLAGYLEAEGCFSLMRHARWVTPVLTVSTTDLDVADLVHDTLNDPNPIQHRPVVVGQKPAYVVTLRGRRAIEWMFTLYPLLGRRRQTRIREVVAAWRLSPGLKRKRNATCHPDKPHRARGLCNSCYIKQWRGRAA